MSDNLELAIKRSIEKAVNEAKDRLLKKYEEKILSEFREEMAKIVLRVENFYSVERQGSNMIITLRDITKNY